MPIPVPRVRMSAADDFAASRAAPYCQRNSLPIFNTGTALTNVDLGSGARGWSLSTTAGVLASANSSNAAYTSFLNPSLASGDKGAVMAVRGAFTNPPGGSSSYPRIGWLSTADEGLRYSRNGAASTGFKADWLATVDTGLAGPILGTSIKTAVIRLDFNRALDGYDTVSIWFEGTAGDAPDAVSTVPANLSGGTLSKLMFSIYNADAATSYALSDFVIWRPEIANSGDNNVLVDFPDAVCRSTAADLAAALALPPSVLTGTAQLDDVAPSGGLAQAGLSVVSGSVQLADGLPTGTLGAAPGAITTNTWKNAAGDKLPNQAVPVVTFQRISDGFQALVLLNQTTSASPTAPTLNFSHGNLVPGTWYMVSAWNADGSICGIEPYQAV